MKEKRLKMKSQISSNYFFPTEKKAQITVFIILGILILFIAIFMIQLTKQTTISELNQEQEKVISRVFGKEGLKIFVDDCLEDGLENGLLVLGKHGRIPKGDGGLADFSEITGITYPTPDDKLFYAITDKEHSPEEQYPCLDGKEPDFCQYRFPNSSVLPNYLIKFGERKLSMNYIEADLESYLKNEITACLAQDITESTKGAVSIDTEKEEIELELEILNDGIKIKTEYPLRFSIGGEEVFYLETFNFFYSPKDFKLKYFLESAITRPLNYDWSFVDFDYKVEIDSESPSFKHGCFNEQGMIENCEEPMLSTLGSVIVEKQSLNTGDDVFVFKIAKDSIFKSGTTVIPSEVPFYTFQFVRQNRPPALDYVSQSRCDGEYDYLVIPGHKDLGKIDITLTAKDPDEDLEDKFNYKFDSDPTLTDEASESEKFLVTSPKPENYKLTATVSDEHGAEDKQDIRVAVDPPIATKISLEMPYSDILQGDRYEISSEDPVFLIVELPDGSKIRERQDIVLSFGTESIKITQKYGKTVVFGSSANGLVIKDKDINEYGVNEIKLGKFSPFNKISNAVQTLKVEHTVLYCDGEDEQSDTSEIDIIVNECIPHKNDTHPFPYPYHEYYYDENMVLKNDDKDANPFLVTHECCNQNDWTVYKKEDNELCFKEEKLGCFGGSKEAILEGYLLEKRKSEAYCTGDRGNICGGEKKETWEYQGVCGNDQEKCTEVDKNCKGKIPYYVEEKKDGYWCHGTLGCGDSCTGTVIDDGTGLFDKFDECRSCGSTDLGKSCYDFKTGIEGICQEEERSWWFGTTEVCKPIPYSR